MTAITPGSRVGVYEVIAAIGAGGMGEVYRARDRALNRDVALKVLPPAFVLDPDRLARFRREAQVLASVNHQNVAAIYGFEESHGVPALVLEFVDGPTLADRIAQGAIPIDEALSIARQIADALEAAHEQGIVHRDLKPANVKLRPDAVVKVLDFGLAKALEADPGRAADISVSPTITSPAMTRMGVILGTAAYMSPEQAKGRPVDKRADIWAFGCVIYEMLTGRRAFAGEDIADTLAFIITKEPDWRPLPPATPPAIHKLLRRCLEKDRRRRLADVADARLEIEEALAAPTADRAAPPAPMAAVTSWWRRPAFIAPVTLLLGAALMLGVATLMAPRPPAAGLARFSIPFGEGEIITGVALPAVTISPDGTQIAYVANGRLYRRPISELAAQPVAGTDGVAGAGIFNPAFSPDSQSIAFLAGNAVFPGGSVMAPTTLETVPLAGGVRTTICSITAPVLGMSWGADGIVFVDHGDTIMRVSPEGRKPETLVARKAGEILQDPQILPGGDAVLFTVVADPGTAGNTLDVWDRGRIVVQSIKSGERKTLIEGGSAARYVATGHLLYAVGGVMFAAPFDLTRKELTGARVPVVEGVLRSIGTPSTGAIHANVSENGTLIFLPGPTAPAAAGFQLAVIDRGGRIEPLKVPPGAYQAPRISPDGSRIAYSIDTGKDANVFVYDLSGQRAMRQLTFGGRNRYPIWSPDGARVAFQSDRDGDLAVFAQRADGTSAAERLTTPASETSHVPESWSKDGSRILFMTSKGSTNMLAELSLPDKKTTVFEDISSQAVLASDFSPDGKWIAYATRQPNQDVSALYVRPFPLTAAKYLVTPNGFRPRWSPDGKELFFARRGQSFVVTVTTAPSVEFGNPVEMPIRRSPPLGLAEREYDVFRDGQRFVFAVPSGMPGGIGPAVQVHVVLNWFQELKQRASAK
jgi:eukaryotic-like serine/threonine-protein kinase